MMKSAASGRSEIQAIVIHLPEELLRLLAPTLNAAADRFKELALTELFRRGEVSSGYAAKVLGMSKADFISLLAEHQVPYLDATEEELRREVEVARSAWPPREDRPSPTADH